jgi:small-conductance mechanosensitive channel
MSKTKSNILLSGGAALAAFCAAAGTAYSKTKHPVFSVSFGAVSAAFVGVNAYFMKDTVDILRDMPGKSSAADGPEREVKVLRREVETLKGELARANKRANKAESDDVLKTFINDLARDVDLAALNQRAVEAEQEIELMKAEQAVEDAAPEDQQAAVDALREVVNKKPGGPKLG